MACAPPGQSRVAAPPGPCPQPALNPGVAHKSKVFLPRERERAEIAATSQGDFNFSLRQGTAWLLLLRSSHTSCGRYWHCPVMLGTSLLKLSRGLDPSRLFRGHLRASSVGPKCPVAPHGHGSIRGWNQRTWNSHRLKLWANNEGKKPALGALKKGVQWDLIQVCIPRTAS